MRGEAERQSMRLSFNVVGLMRNGGGNGGARQRVIVLKMMALRVSFSTYNGGVAHGGVNLS
jgi:hypothetical protein